MAKFLQETLRESGIKGGKLIVGTEEFKEFFYKVTPLSIPNSSQSLTTTYLLHQGPIVR